MGHWIINKKQTESFMSYQKVIIMGKLGQDVQLKNLPSGSSVANFSVATSEKWNDKATGEKQEKTEWHTINVFGAQAENCAKYLGKGSDVLVEGKLNTRSWEKDGVKRYSTEITANSVQFIGSKKQESSTNNNASTDLPF